MQTVKVAKAPIKLGFFNNRAWVAEWQTHRT